MKHVLALLLSVIILFSANAEPPDYINESPLLPGTKKPFFNILLDDRAGLESAYLVLKHVVNYVNTESRKCR